MAEEEEWKKLSTENKVQHKAWKARAEGYKECLKNFDMWEEKSPEFSKYLGLVKKFVTDSNELIRVQGLEVTLKFVENAHVAPKTYGEVLSGIIAKCFSAKPKHKVLAMDVCLMYIERDQNEHIEEELLKGLENKNPKVIAGCLETLTLALSVFGSKVINVKPLLKQTPKLLDHRDKTVRESTKALYIEIYKWIGPAIKTPLQNINAIVFKELEEDWNKIGDQRSKQTRFMRSQQDLKEKAEKEKAAAEDGASGEPGGNDNAEEEIDAYELLDPVEILSKLPKNFYELIEAKKWQQRKEALETCLKLCESPKLEAGDYGDLMRALKKVIAKDTNIMLVTLAAKCVAGCANGLRKKFHPFSSLFIDSIIEKFKEKKITVVKALQEAIDAVYMSTSLQNITETVIEGLKHKNPSIKEQTSLFLERVLRKSKNSINKSTIKQLCVPLIVNMDHSAPNVREATFAALGAMSKLVGDRIMAPYLADVDKLKLDKINEAAGKVQKEAVPVAKKAETSQPAPKPEKKASAAKTAAPKKVISGGKKKGKDTNKDKKKEAAPVEESELSETAIEDIIAEFLPEEPRKQIFSANWKERLEGLQQVVQKIKISEKKELPCQAIVCTLGTGKPGWKDSNFNCLNTKFEIVKLLSMYGVFSKTSANACFQILVEKIGDVKCGNASKEALSSIAEAVKLPYVAQNVLERGFSQKNPKIQAESINWLSNAIKEFGINGVDIKLIIAKIKTAFAATNPAVRTSAFGLTGTLALYMGEKIRMFFDSEKPALLQQIDNELEKVKGQSAPVPTRGVQVKEEGSDGNDEDEETKPADVNDLIPRTDISSKITDAIIEQLADKNWKIRKEGLGAVTTILDENKFITPSLGELPASLKLRLGDSNKVLVMTTLNILTQLSVALGPHCSGHVKTFVGSFIKTLQDSKPNVRQTALNCMNQWLENTQLSVWLEDDTIGTALSVPKNVYLRIELLNWLSEKLLATPKISNTAKEGLEGSVKWLCACCEDRSADVRSKAQGALPAYIYHLGMDKMMRLCGKSPNSNNMLGLLESAKEKVPERKSKQKAKPPPQKVEIPEVTSEEVSTSTASASENKEVKSEKTESQTQQKGKSKLANKNKRGASSSRKQQPEPSNTSEAITLIPNGKEQRIKDEAKLKTLKWIFQAPREELIIQLKTQCAACMSAELLAEMFHTDFQHHLKALTILTQCMNSNWTACFSTLDLQLRWVTLRFYDTNTTVHIQCMEYLKSAFEHLESENIRLTDYEAVSLLPHLIIKIGENKDNIRKGVHGILQQIRKVYPASKVFTHLMNGLVSKNSRQRTECLDELSISITNHGIDVCQPSAPKALREVATHIGDRDKGVRSAALNVLVAAYNVCGEIIYKHAGKLSDKDRGMLEERIKRSGKYSPPEKNSQKVAASKPKPSSTGDNIPDKRNNSKEKNEQIVNTSHLHSSGIPKSKEDEFTLRFPELLDTDCDDLLNLDTQLPPTLLANFDRYIKTSTIEAVESTLSDVIIRLTNSDFETSLTALHQLNAILMQKEKRPLLKPKIDQILMASSISMRTALQSHFNKKEDQSPDSTINKFYKSLISFNISLFSNAEFAVLPSIRAIEDATQSFLMFIIDERWYSDDYDFVGKFYIEGINRVITQICAYCNPVNLVCALLGLLKNTSDLSPNKYIDLVLKCIWKIWTTVGESFSGHSEEKVDIKELLKILSELLNLQAKHHSILNMKHISKTIKTIVVKLCTSYGAGIAKEIELIDVDTTEICKIIDREMSKHGHPTCKADLGFKGKKENMVNGNEAVSLEAQLSAIFKKIGKREQTKVGLEELYIFKKQNPYYDIEPEISGVTPLFKNYINKGLQNIEQERIKNGDFSLIPKAKPNMEKPYSAKDAFARFEMLRAKCGISPSTDIPKPAVLTTNNNKLNHAADDFSSIKMPTKPVASKPEIPRPSTAPAQQSIGRPASVEELKRRLERIKSNSRKNSGK